MENSLIWIIVTSAAAAIISIYFGYQKVIHLQNLKRSKFLLFLLIVAIILTILRILHINGLFPEEVGGASMSGFYSSVSGFLLGGALSNYREKRKCGRLLYRNRTFFTDYLPVILSIALLMAGIYRSSLLSDLPVTPIRLTSGLSIFMLGLWTLTIQAVPEIRDRGLILLDRYIPWQDFVSYSWFDSDSIQLEYKLDGHLHVFNTRVPEEDQIEVEHILNEKLMNRMEMDS
jgi:hypothetical protein